MKAPRSPQQRNLSNIPIDIQQLICDFLFMANYNRGRITYRLRDIFTHCILIVDPRLWNHNSISVITGCAVAQALCQRRHIIPMGVGDFLTVFPLGSGCQTPRRTFTQNGSNDVFSRKDVPFAVKVATFHTP